MAVTRIERDLVARYDAETGGHFGPHRDDTGISVAHRRFAVSINLNADFDGGEISFPEYSPRTFKAAPGAAVVFSASILHQVSRVTRGRRYVFLTFLFDEDGRAAATGEFEGRAGGATPIATNGERVGQDFPEIRTAANRHRERKRSDPGERRRPSASGLLRRHSPSKRASAPRPSLTPLEDLADALDLPFERNRRSSRAPGA